MKQEYIINGETVVMMSINDSCCKIIEKDENFIVNKSLSKILDESCKYFGSSLKGRIESSKYILKYDYKLPIIIDEYREIIIFPLRSYFEVNNNIIFLNQIKDYEKINEGIKLILYNNSEIIIKDSFRIFENQYLRSQKLLIKLKNLKNISQ